MAAEDSYALQRFVEAQRRTYDRALAEISDGRKSSHWMWFVFPQVAGLGQSQMSRTYAISSLDEARAYLRHAVLGPRLLESARVLAATSDRSAEEIFGAVDAQKLQSSMTLFARAAPDEPVFEEVLSLYFRGNPDAATLARL